MVSIKIKHIPIYDPAIPLAVICNSQKLRTAQIPTSRLMNEQFVIYSCNGILFSNKKERAIYNITMWVDLNDAE